MIAAGKGQTITKDIHFDYYLNSTDNDFINHFSNGPGLLQIQNNGITGGCLSTPDSIQWGSDNAFFCSRYKPNAGDTTITAISFKYDSAFSIPGSIQRAVSIWLIPYADFNHYIAASITKNKKIELLTYSWNNNPYPVVTLTQDHWYRFEISTVFIGGISFQVNISAKVSDLGVTGTGPPSLVNSSSGTFNDNVLVNDTSIEVGLSGTKRGGAKYLDDFHFEGREGLSDCIDVPVGLKKEFLIPFFIYTSASSNEIVIEQNFSTTQNMDILLYDIQGKKLIQYNTIGRTARLNISFLSNGVYIIQCTSGNGFSIRQIIIKR